MQPKRSKFKTFRTSLSSLAFIMSSLALAQVTPNGAHKALLPAVSSDFRRTMTAAVDPSSTIEDLVTYARQARVQVRTNQDALIFKKFIAARHAYEDAK